MSLRPPAKNVKSAILTALLPMLMNCSAVKDAYTVDSVTRDPDATLLDDNPLLQKGQYVPPAFDLYRAPYPGDVNPTGGLVPPDNSRPITSVPTAVFCVLDASSQLYKADGQQCRSAYVFAGTSAAARNALMAFLLRRSDDICHLHEAGIFSVGAQSNFTLSELATVLGGLGALFTPASTVRALSGSSALVNATRDNFNQVFFQNLLSSAIVKAIEAKRQQQRAALDSNYQKTATQYAVDQMLADVADYHASCSFYAGVAALTEAAGRVARSTDEIQSRIASLKLLWQGELDAVKKYQEQNFAAGSDADKSRLTSIERAQHAADALQAQIAALETQVSISPGAPSSVPPSGTSSTVDTTKTGTAPAAPKSAGQ